MYYPISIKINKLIKIYPIYLSKQRWGSLISLILEKLHIFKNLYFLILDFLILEIVLFVFSHKPKDFKNCLQCRYTVQVYPTFYII